MKNEVVVAVIAGGGAFGSFTAGRLDRLEKNTRL